MRKYLLIILLALAAPVIALGATYTVSEKDTLKTIADQFGVKKSDISGYRSGNPDLIFAGEELNIATGIPLFGAGDSTVGTLNPWKTSSTIILPRNASSSLRVPSLANCTGDLETDGDGDVACGTDEGGAGSGITSLNGLTTSTQTFVGSGVSIVSTGSTHTFTVSGGGGGGSIGTSSVATAGYIPNWASASTLTGSSTLFNNAGNIGLNTLVPSSTLHIIGSFQVSATSTLGGNLVFAGDTIDELVGTGLQLSAGDLQTTLGVSIAASEIADGDHGDFTYTSGVAAIDANAVVLATDTSGNYVATIADAGNTTITVANSGTENAAVTLDVVDVNCTGCLGSTEIAGLSLTADVTGILPTANGGTASSTWTAGGIVYASSSALLSHNAGNFFWDNGNVRLGIATSTPASTLHVVGTFTLSGNATFGSNIIIGGDTISDFVGTGLSLSGSTLQTTLGTSVDLAAEVTGVLPIANGGLATSTVPGALKILVGNGTNYDLPTYSAGRSLSLTNTSSTFTVNGDSELFTFISNVAISNPSTTDDGVVQLKFPSAATITRISCSTDTGTSTIQFDERAEVTPNTGGTDVMTAALACGTVTTSTTSFSNASIASNAPMSLDVDAITGTSTMLRIHVERTNDD